MHGRVTMGVRDNAHSGYRVDVENHLIPGIGAHRLEKLQPEHLERLYAKMQRTGLRAGTAHHVHRTIRNALNEAVRRGRIARNPALLAKAPAVAGEEVEPYKLNEIRRLLEAASTRRNSARWAVALALGLRQGEALGLKWSDIDLDEGIMRIRRAALRPKYVHGCGDTCGLMPGYCPQRRSVRPPVGDMKSRAGRRTVGLPPELITLLGEHRKEQEAERAAAPQFWHEEGWVFASQTGERLNYRSDHHEWKRLLSAAGLRTRACTMLATPRRPSCSCLACRSEQ